MSRPLEGIKVVEVAMWAFVPSAGGILSDMGAAVIKVEPPSGDPLRGLQTGLGGEAQPAIDFSWEAYNRGKQSITLDLKQKAGIEVLYRLLEGADVLVWTTEDEKGQAALRANHDVVAARSRSVFTTKEQAGAIAYASPLSYPLVADQLPPLIANILH